MGKSSRSSPGFFESLGRVKTAVSFWITLILFVILIGFGGYWYFSNSYTGQTDAVLKVVNCRSMDTIRNQTRTTTYDCAGQQEYTVDGKTYDHSYSESGLLVPREKGQTVMIYYDPKNPTDISTVGKSQLGKILFIIGIILLIILGVSYFRYRMAKKSKTWATGEGVWTGFSFVFGGSSRNF